MEAKITWMRYRSWNDIRCITNNMESKNDDTNKLKGSCKNDEIHTKKLAKQRFHT